MSSPERIDVSIQDARIAVPFDLVVGVIGRDILDELWPLDDASAPSKLSANELEDLAPNPDGGERRERPLAHVELSRSAQEGEVHNPDDVVCIDDVAKASGEATTKGLHAATDEEHEKTLGFHLDLLERLGWTVGSH